METHFGRTPSDQMKIVSKELYILFEQMLLNQTFLNKTEEEEEYLKFKDLFM